MKAYQDTFSIKKHKFQELRIYLHIVFIPTKKFQQWQFHSLPIYIFYFFLYSVFLHFWYTFYFFAHVTERNRYRYMKFLMKLSLSIQYKQRNERKDYVKRTRPVVSDSHTFTSTFIYLNEKRPSDSGSGPLLHDKEK